MPVTALSKKLRAKLGQYEKCQLTFVNRPVKGFDVVGREQAHSTRQLPFPPGGVFLAQHNQDIAFLEGQLVLLLPDERKQGTHLFCNRREDTGQVLASFSYFFM
ncbi:hypothetical protein MRX96_016399 [Rhipicephalus microplus]